MKKLLISLGVVAMMFFAQAADVNAKTCDQKADAYCVYDNSTRTSINCCDNIICNNTSAGDKAIICNKYCSYDTSKGAVVASDCD